MPTAKKVFSILRQTAIILTVTVVLSEISLRIYHQLDPLPIFYDTSYNRFRSSPLGNNYGFRLNSRGFKDVEFSPEKAEGTFRILGIGDSFAYGVVPYENNYLTILEDDLKQSDEKIELINMGIPSIGTRDYVSLLLHEGLELNPDLVLVSFFIGNDFRERRKIRLYEYSYLLTAIKYASDLHTKFEGGNRHDVAKYDDNSKTFSDDAYLSLARGGSYLFSKENKHFAAELDTALSYTLKLREICRQRKIQLTIVIIPDEMQVNKALQGKVVSSLGLGPNDFDFSLPNKLLMAKLKEQNIQYIDLLDDFISASEHGVLYKPNDTHWNIAGNRIAAQLIGKHLTPQIKLRQR